MAETNKLEKQIECPMNVICDRDMKKGGNGSCKSTDEELHYSCKSYDPCIAMAASGKAYFHEVDSSLD